MLQLLSELVNGKRVLILGYGMEGRSTHALLGEINTYAQLAIADIKHPENTGGYEVFSGPDYLEHINDFDVVFKSPGIVLPRRFSDYDCKITSQTEVFLQHFSKQVIGVTGTKGKSTVSSLLYHTLKVNNVPCFFAGNIGKPVFDIAKHIRHDTVVVLELSCHQLEICSVSPAVSVLLNIYEDHLDHYNSFEDYANTKKNIYLHQQPQDVLYCTASVKPSGDEAASRVFVVTSDVLPFGTLEDIGGVKLRGKHNLENCAFVYSIAKSFGITDDKFVASLQSYTPLRHRLEFIGSMDGVDYYDDSISTTVESTIHAIESVSNAATVLLGGMDRGINYSGLVDYLATCRLSNVICMYESGRRIYEMLESRRNVSPTIAYCKDLYVAAETARQLTPRGAACILSPASASYGDFKNFEERGDVFKRLIFGNKT